MSDDDIKPGPVPAEVISYWRQKKLKPTFDYRTIWLEENLFSFHVAKVMRTDVLEVLHTELERSITHGIPFDQWKSQIAPKLEAVGWWHPHDVVDPETGKVAHVDPPRRLQTIFDTNMRTAHAIGQWDRIQRNKRYRPYLLYIHGHPVRPRPIHLSWHGLLLPIDDEFWSFAFPPGGWNCTCQTRTVSEREARTLEDEGVVAGDAQPILDHNGNPTGHLEDKRVAVVRTAPVVERKPWLNKHTGKIEMVPEGIDPGFQWPPSVARQKWLDTAAAE